MKQSFIFIAALLFSLNISAQEAEKQDSLNIPVILVDGVEVSDMDNIAKDDIQSVTVIKTPSVTKLFAPRLGGVICVITKSKKYLKEIIEKYQEEKEKADKKKEEGKTYIR
ncbi:hypothetical protein [Prevotella veroralis]|uniref:hypothetical protein n=1 Tax=Prevotella veroralis TaxID=28137 RepID=UPI0003726524|nr:hypothetical protein [Prevotella veroralis]